MNDALRSGTPHRPIPHWSRRAEPRPCAAASGAADGRKPLVADGGRQSGADDADHLRDLPDGAGCAEIWEHLSARQGGEGCAPDGRSQASGADD